MSKLNVAIVGGGPAGLMTASKLDADKFNVTVYDRNQALGRKFLVAGKGGLNITHSEDIDQLKTRYTQNESLLKALNYFSNQDLIKWLDDLGIETFYGSSKRVFPVKKHKPIKVYKALLNYALEQGIDVQYEHTWLGYDADDLVFKNNEEEVIKIKADIIIFALGGGSWSVTGSKGEWLSYFNSIDVKVKPFEASNAAFAVKWKKAFIEKYEGSPLKNIEIHFKDILVKGELVISQFGLEGGPIYALSKPLRDELNNGVKPTIYINFKPRTKPEAIIRKLKEPKKRNSWSEHIIYKLKLPRAAFYLLKKSLDKDAFQDPEKIAEIIQYFPIQIEDIASVEEAISTVGGIEMNEVNENFELKKRPNSFVIGEMLDWDAPTGGYLLQGAFSMGAYLAHHINKTN